MKYFTKDWFEKMQHSSQQATADAYAQNLHKQFGDSLPEFYKNFRLHDCRLKDYGMQGEDYSITIASDCMSGLKQVIFRKATVLKQDDTIEKASWLYDELYRTYNGYQLHALLFRRGQLIEFTVACRDVTLISAETSR
ncbi:MAG: DUF4085 family protein [Clostridia bacterium]|nr:DUF4085 family protein [Clostridia bacterium]